MSKIDKIKEKITDVKVVSKGANKSSSRRQSSSKNGSKRLYRSRNDVIIGGVCGGVANYFDLNPTIVRIVWFLVSLFYGVGILFYLIFWLIVPVE